MKSIFFSILIATACTQAPDPKKMNDDERLAYAKKLSDQFILADGHVDLPYRMKVAGFRLKKEIMDVSIRTPDGDFDYVRAREGGLDAPFMSIYVPSRFNSGGAKNYADSLIDLVEGVAEKFPAQFVMAKSPDDIITAAREKKIALPMGMENGAPIENDLANVAYFHAQGIRYITLTHSKDNQISDSSYDTLNTWKGLSPFGEQVVKEMNRVGIMVDISHVSDSAFYDVLRLTNVPVIASHSSCRKFTPGFQRNMDDEMIKALAKNGGVIMINFGSTFLSEESRKKFDEVDEHVKNWLAQNQLKESDSAAQAYINQYLKVTNPFSTVQIVADHIDHVKKLVGIDHIGLGSDFDGVGNSLPTGLKDVSEYPNLLAELLKRGYTDQEIEKICSGNIFRVWREVEKAAKG